MKKNRQILELQNRVRELEGLLCPCEQHDWVKTGRVYNSGASYCYSRDAWDVSYECKRCHKRIVEKEF